MPKVADRRAACQTRAPARVPLSDMVCVKRSLARMAAGGQGDFTMRAFTHADLPEAVELWAGAFGVELPDEDARLKAAQRLAFSIDSDPAGSFAAEIEGRLVGLRRRS